MKRKIYYPDGHAYCGMCFLGFIVLMFSFYPYALGYRANILNGIWTFQLMIFLVFLRSLFPDCFHVLIGSRALFYCSFDAVFVVRIKSCKKLFDCVRICPLTGFTVQMFSHIEDGEDNPHPTVRRVAWGMFFVGWSLLFVKWIVVLVCNCNGSGLYPSDFNDILKCGVVMLFEGGLFALRYWQREKYVRWIGIRKLVRIPDDERERKKLFRTVRKCDGYRLYKDRDVLPFRG